MSFQKEMVSIINNRVNIETHAHVPGCSGDSKLNGDDGKSNLLMLERLQDRNIDLDKINIGYLNLSARANNALKIYHVDTVLKLLNCSDDYLLSLRNLGQTSLHQIREKLTYFIEYLANIDDSSLPLVGVSTNIAIESLSVLHPGNEQQSISKVAKKDLFIDLPEKTNPLFDFESAFEQLFKNLTDREKRVLVLRNGLYDGNPLTLGKISPLLNNVSRERVRQIEKKAKRKICHYSRSYVRTAMEDQFEYIFLQAGGVINQLDITNKLHDFAILGRIHPNGVTQFVLSTSSRFNQISENVWALDGYYSTHFTKSVSQVIQILEKNQTRMRFNYLVAETLKNNQSDYKELDESTSLLYIEACIKNDPQFELVEDGWCILAKWRSSFIYQIVDILKSSAKPLHYRDITESINLQLKANEKVAEHNIHAILQRQHNIFVLSEPGKYGLVEWGIKRPQLFVNIIIEILKLEGNPLPIGEIIKRINEKRSCKKTSVVMYLTMNDRFVEFQRGMYGLKEWLQSNPEDKKEVPISFVNELQERLAFDLHNSSDK
jgi:Bacterial RNA polymerase, alpha chain C terminal domain/Sigma-70, region 4